MNTEAKTDVQPTPSTAGSVREALEELLRCANAIVGANVSDPDASEAFQMFDDARVKARRSLALSAPVEAPMACMNCGRSVGEHSMDTADVCNTFIGQEQPQYRCAICGFVIDTRYEATKPTIEFGMAGRAKTATPRPLPSVEQIAQIIDGNEYWTARTKATAILTLLGVSAR